MDRILKREVETGCEYTLPDYMGDIKRVLGASASAVPAGKFISDGTLELSGLVNFEVIYSDSDGKLTAFTASADLDVKEGVDTSGEVDASMELGAGAVSLRVIGPRRIALRSAVTVSVTVSEESRSDIGGDVFGESSREDVETMSVGIKALSSRFYTSGAREYAEEACRLVGVTSDEVEIIATSGRVNVTEATAEDGGVRVKGEMIITALVRTDEQPPFAIKKIIPFDERVEIEGAETGNGVSASAYLTSETVGIAEDGDATVLSANAICEIGVRLSENRNIELIKDAYLIDRETRSAYERLDYLEEVARLRIDSELSHKVKRSELGISEAREIVLVNAEPKIEEKHATGDGARITGVCRISGVACEISASGEPVYSPFKTEAPFTVSASSTSRIPDGAELECMIRVGDIECTLEPDALSVSTDLFGEVRVITAHSIERLASCSAVGEERIDTPPSEIVVYYPDADETLYDVSKLHHARMADVAAKCGVSVEASTNDGVTPLRSLGIKHVMLP